MGILDALNYIGQPQGNGLLDFLRANGLAQQIGTPGLPSDQAQYGSAPAMAYAPASIQANSPSPLDNARWPIGPTGAPSQAMAQAPATAAVPAPVVPQSVEPDTGNRLMAGIQSWANTPGGILGRLANSAAGFSTGQRADPTGVAEQKALLAQNVTMRALIAKGVDPQVAQAAIASPEVLKALVADKFGKDKYSVVKTGTDTFGKEQYQVFNPSEGTFKPVSGANGEGDNQPSYDNNLKGDDYLKQFPPEVQSQVRDYIAGKTMPTGNPRRDNVIKRIASKYGEDIGTPADDTTFGARRQMRTQLSSSAPASLGGQINIGNTAAGHLADLTEKALELGNYDTGIAPLSGIINSVRGLGTEQAAKMEALKGAAQHYGQEITKFYAGSPGGVAERDRFIESVNGARSPKELAAILSTEGELMRSRLDALGGQIKGVLGEEGMKQYPVLRPEGQAALTKVEENVAKLRGGAPKQEPAKSATLDRSAIEAEMRRRGLLK